MKATTFKLKKLKSKRVYGFRSEQFNMINNGLETTTVPTVTSATTSGSSRVMI